MTYLKAFPKIFRGLRIHVVFLLRISWNGLVRIGSGGYDHLDDAAIRSFFPFHIGVFNL